MERAWLKSYPKVINTDIDPDKYQSLADLMDLACKKYADKTSFVCLGKEISFTEYNRLADCFASYLQNEAGLIKGDRIAIMLPNLIDFPVVFFAAQKLGLICVNTNPLYTPREMRHQFKDSGCKSIVILDIFLGKLQEVLPDTQIKTIISASIGDFMPAWKAALVSLVLRLNGTMEKHSLKPARFKDALKIGSKKAFTRPKISLQDTAVLQYTGGTTGLSKGAELTQRNIISNLLQIEEWAKTHCVESQETILTVLPLYHIFALTVNFLAFMNGGQKNVLVPKPIPIKKSVEQFKKYRITVVTAVNTLFNALVNDPEFQKLDHSSIKVAMAGGMALQSSVARRWEEVTHNAAFEGYGLTEASPVTHANPIDKTARVGTIGLPLPSTYAKVVDETGKEVAPGEVGELIVKGPQVMKGYWNQPEETKKTIRDGWLWTGDMAKMSADGYFAIVDRKKDMIIVSGFNVYPNEVEDVIASHPKILEAAVIGVDDPKSGEVVKAFYVPKDASVTSAELEEYCRKNLVAYKVPKQWAVIKELPKSNIGKIIRRKLKESQPKA